LCEEEGFNEIETSSLVEKAKLFPIKKMDVTRVYHARKGF